MDHVDCQPLAEKTRSSEKAVKEGEQSTPMVNQERYVFVLGAGASCNAGAPLMATFFDKAREVMETNLAGPDLDDFKAVFEARSKLLKLRQKWDFDLHNMEQVFGAFEMDELLGTLQLPPTLRRSMPKVIGTTITQTMKFPTGSIGGTTKRLFEPHTEYRRLGQIIAELRAVKKKEVSVISLNCDLGVEMGLRGVGIENYDYCLHSEPLDSGVPILKLHGSLNWRRCDSCKKVVHAPIPKEHVGGSEEVPLELLSHTCPHCARSTPDDPVIVPPTWDKAAETWLLPVWRRAAKELSQAHVVCVCGYSMPASDAHFQYLFALGAASNTVWERFCVIDQSEEVKKKFEGLVRLGHPTRFWPLASFESDIVTFGTDVLGQKDWAK